MVATHTLMILTMTTFLIPWTIANLRQIHSKGDIDADNIGDACDGDIDGDNVNNSLPLDPTNVTDDDCPFVNATGQTKIWMAVLTSHHLTTTPMEMVY